MARVNFRDTYSFDPYGAENAGGLLGMLQAIMRQGQAGAGAGSDPRASASEPPSLSQAADYGPAPTTRITVRPLDPYSAPEETQGSDGDLIGRLLALQAEQGGYQPRPVNSEQSQSAPLDPNFRQLSRTPVEGSQQAEAPPVDTPGDQSAQPYPSGYSNAAVQPQMPQSAKTARPDRSLSDRVQAVWDHPHPYGLIAMLKTALDGMKIAVQSAYDATSEPSTEEEAFRRNLGREMGPIGAWNAVSSLLPTASGRMGRIVARPVRDGLRDSLPWLRDGAPIGGKRIQERIANTGVPPSRFGPPNTNRFSTLQSAADAANRMSALADVASWSSVAPPPMSELTFSEWQKRTKLEMASRKGSDGNPAEPSEKGKRILAELAARKAARVEAARKAAPVIKHDPNDYCWNRRTEDEQRCNDRKDEYTHEHFLPACMDRAVERWDMCNRNGGRPHPAENAEWGPLDEDEYYNVAR